MCSWWKIISEECVGGGRGREGKVQRWGLGVDDVRVLGKGFGKRRRVKVSRINQSGTLTRKMDYAAVKTEGAIKFRPHRSTDLLCSVFLFCQFYIRSFAVFASIHCSKGIGQDCQKSRQIRFLFDESWTKVGRKLDENWTNRVKNGVKIRRPRDISAVPRASKVDNSRLRSRGETKVVRSKDGCDRQSILPRFRDFSYRARPTRFIELCYFFSLFFFFSFFTSVASPPLLILERDNVPLCDFECFMCSLGVFPSRGLEEKKVWK